MRALLPDKRALLHAAGRARQDHLPGDSVTPPVRIDGEVHELLLLLAGLARSRGGCVLAEALVAIGRVPVRPASGSLPGRRTWQPRLSKPLCRFVRLWLSRGVEVGPGEIVWIR